MAMIRRAVNGNPTGSSNAYILVAGIPLASQTPTNFIKVHKVGKKL
jgi:hypothetical protein